MKVLIIASNINKSPEDVSYSFVFDEAYRLAKRGLEIRIIRSSFTNDDSEFSFNLYFYGLGYKRLRLNALYMIMRNIREYSIYSFIRSPKAIYFENLYAWRTLNIASRVKPDIIHAHFAYPEGFVGCSVKKKTGIPFVVTVHGYDILTEPSVGYGIRLKKSYDVLVRKVLNCADVVICNSRALYDESLKLVNDAGKLKLIYHGVDLRLFYPREKGEARVKLGLPLDKYIVFTAKHHQPQYGIEYLIKSIPEIVSKTKDVLFVIGGDGPLKSFYEELARSLGVSNYVVFVGQIPRGLMPYYYAASDIVVVPSLQESWGLVATEAMASGRPVIASSVGGLKEQVIDGINGFLAPPRDPRGIAEKILYFLENPPEIERMGLNGRRLAEEKFDIEKRIDRIIEIYSSLI